MCLAKGHGEQHSLRLPSGDWAAGAWLLQIWRKCYRLFVTGPMQVAGGGCKKVAQEAMLPIFIWSEGGQRFVHDASTPQRSEQEACNCLAPL